LFRLPERAMMTGMSSTKPGLSDDALLPSPAGAGSGAGQPAITPWLQTADNRLVTQLTDRQRAWVLAVCEVSHARGGKLTPTGVVRAAVDRLIGEHADAATAAEVLAGG
jgi:hypothetical protein